MTTSQVTDASPAAFVAHVDDRDKQSEIAKQYITDTKVDVILGGGEDRWLPAGSAGAYPDNPPEDPEEASASDQGDLIAEAQSLGYRAGQLAAGLVASGGIDIVGGVGASVWGYAKARRRGATAPLVFNPRPVRSCLGSSPMRRCSSSAPKVKATSTIPW